jgi:hypothetical protein
MYIITGISIVEVYLCIARNRDWLYKKKKYSLKVELYSLRNNPPVVWRPIFLRE